MMNHEAGSGVTVTGDAVNVPVAVYLAAPVPEVGEMLIDMSWRFAEPPQDAIARSIGMARKVAISLDIIPPRNALLRLNLARGQGDCQRR
jgi:hypothetical protein